MEQGVLRDLVTPAQHPATAGTEPVLNLAIVYEDAPTRQWAAEMCERVARLVGADAVRCTWWKLGELGEPAVLAGAVSTALRADVLVIAIHAAEALSLPFYVWVESWLPHRPPRLAALVALVALPRRPSLEADRAQDYLRAVARQGQLDFLLEERKLAGEPAPAREPGRLPRALPTTTPPVTRARSPRHSPPPWLAGELRFKTSAAA